MKRIIQQLTARRPNSTLDLVRFWEVRGLLLAPGHHPVPLIWRLQLYEDAYPLLFWVSMNILPAQASSVPYGRVFSSSKGTCTPRRSALAPKLMEALKVLTFKCKQEGLSFTSHCKNY